MKKDKHDKECLLIIFDAVLRRQGMLTRRGWSWSRMTAQCRKRGTRPTSMSGRPLRLTSTSSRGERLQGPPRRQAAGSRRLRRRRAAAPLQWASAIRACCHFRGTMRTSDFRVRLQMLPCLFLAGMQWKKADASIALHRWLMPNIDAGVWEEFKEFKLHRLDKKCTTLLQTHL